MVYLLNQGSYVVLAATALVTAVVAITALGVTPLRLGLLALLALALLAYPLAMRTGRGAAVEDLDAALNRARPVLVELYSDF